MKRLPGIVAALSMAVCLCLSCGEPLKPDNPDNPDNPSNPDNPGTSDNPDNPSGPFFDLLNGISNPVTEGQEVIFNRDATGTTFIVNTNIDDWSAEASEAWCDVSKDENGNLMVLVPEYGEWNEMLPPRISSVRVTAGTVFDRTIYIIQQSSLFINFPQLVFDQSLWSDKLPLSPAGETAEVLVYTNCYKWVPTADVSWLKLEVVDATTLRITSSANTDGNTQRRGTVTLTAASDDFIHSSFTVVDGDPSVTGSDYTYGEHSNWD